MTEEAKTLQPWQQRVVDEHKDAADKLARLRAYTHSPEEGEGKFLSLPHADRLLLMRQHAAMTAYVSVLGERIARFR
jgi:hypothetical protein